MNLKLFSIPALALCIASPTALKANASPLQPSPSSAQYQDQDDWGRAPNRYREAQRRGYEEGVEAARRDFYEHRHADADDHDIYKHPPVDESARHDFREGFKEGYRRAMDRMRHDRDRDRDYNEPHF